MRAGEVTRGAMHCKLPCCTLSCMTISIMHRTPAATVVVYEEVAQNTITARHCDLQLKGST